MFETLDMLKSLLKFQTDLAHTSNKWILGNMVVTHNWVANPMNIDT